MTQDGPEGRAENAEPRAVIDTSVAHQSRIYDYWLGGKENFAVDREADAAYPGPDRPVLRRPATTGTWLGAGTPVAARLGRA